MYQTLREKKSINEKKLISSKKKEPTEENMN